MYHQRERGVEGEEGKGGSKGGRGRKREGEGGRGRGREGEGEGERMLRCPRACVRARDTRLFLLRLTRAIHQLFHRCLFLF